MYRQRCLERTRTNARGLNLPDELSEKKCTGQDKSLNRQAVTGREHHEKSLSHSSHVRDSETPFRESLTKEEETAERSSASSFEERDLILDSF